MLGNLAAHQETGKGRHFPNLAVNLGRRFKDRKIHIGTDVEHRDLNRPDIALDGIDHRDDLFFDASISWVSLRLIAFVADRLCERLQLFDIARPAVDTCGQPFTRKSPRNCAAGCVTCADNKRCCHQAFSSVHWRGCWFFDAKSMTCVTLVSATS